VSRGNTLADYSNHRTDAMAPAVNTGHDVEYNFRQRNENADLYNDGLP
jgi:hypothetical protein